jgi:hypothetical protein
MSEKQQQRVAHWRQQIAEHEKSNQSVREFCRQRGLNEHSFYMWRQRLREQPVSFALVETRTSNAAANQPIEIVLAGGERIRVPADAASLQLVLNTLRQIRT